tara:strand:- start:98 stop:358 length:261 start_codon:yes stop_codon:yes gene_type:complete
MVVSKVVGELIDKCVIEFRKEENMERINKNVIDPLIYHLLKKLSPYIIVTIGLFFGTFLLVVITLCFLICKDLDIFNKLSNIKKSV